MFAYVDGKHHVSRIIRLDRYGPGIDNVYVIQSDPYPHGRGPHDIKMTISALGWCDVIVYKLKKEKEE